MDVRALGRKALAWLARMLSPQPPPVLAPPRCGCTCPTVTLTVHPVDAESFRPWLADADVADAVRRCGTALNEHGRSKL